ncbi:MAG: hypothetical protein R3B72_41175 [Polyangiaceae bacterium]
MRDAVTSTTGRALSLLVALNVLSACGDDEHKGTISHGSAAPPSVGSAAPVATTLLVYSPGTPIASMRVAEVFRKRLAALSIDAKQIRVGGEVVHVEIPSGQKQAVMNALAGGRLDVYAASARDPIGALGEDALGGMPRKTETHAGPEGSVTSHFLLGPDAETLRKRAEGLDLGAKPLVGPASKPDEGFRTYLADSSRQIRGEQVSAAAITSDGAAPRLSLTFEGNGRSFLRWSSKQKVALLVLIDGQVLARVTPDAEITDGVLSFPLTIDDAAAKKLAAALDGVALSHDTVFKEAK